MVISLQQHLASSEPHHTATSDGLIVWARLLPVHAMSTGMDTSATKTAINPLFDRELLTRRRDRAAATIASSDFLLQRVRDDLVERVGIVHRHFADCVVLGAHHGLVARSLRALPNVGLVIEADSSPRLLELCDGPRVLADEEAIPFGSASLDLVVSALALQHVNDLPGVLAQVRRALRPDGLLLAAMAGGRTLCELRDVMLEAELETQGGASPRVAPFADVRDTGALLQRAGFALPVVDSDTVSVTYPTPIALMRDLRCMGAGNVLLDRARRPLRRDTLMRACALYAERYATAEGRVRATFEIISMTAWAPHESQPQPLRPGSAKTRLADVLAPRGSDATATKSEDDDS